MKRTKLDSHGTMELVNAPIVEHERKNDMASTTPTETPKARGPKRPAFVKQANGLLTRISKVSVSPAGTPKENRDYREYTEVRFPSVKVANDYFKGDEKKLLAALSLGANATLQMEIRKANNQETIKTTAKRVAELTGRNVDDVFKELLAAATKRAKSLEAQ